MIKHGFMNLTPQKLKQKPLQYTYFTCTRICYLEPNLPEMYRLIAICLEQVPKSSYYPFTQDSSYPICVCTK